ncbi:MAG: hypothetical protein E3J60_01170 [Dehalococcoidia bacterium]|nr:MAG: hypothetical protein E3J60_01170 [Dehalococcoidia bacterium]
MAEQDIREQVADVLYWNIPKITIKSAVPTMQETRNIADQILSLAISRGGGVCPECKGDKKVSKENGRDAVGDIYTEIIDCPTCKGTGYEETKEIKEIIEEWKDGQPYQ